MNITRIITIPVRAGRGLSEVKIVDELVEFEEEKLLMTVLVCSWNTTKNTPNIRWEETYFVLYN